MSTALRFTLYSSIDSDFVLILGFGLWALAAPSYSEPLVSGSDFEMLLVGSQNFRSENLCSFKYRF